MKNIFIVFFTIFGFTACDPPEYMSNHDAYWYVKNTTDNPVIVTLPNFSDNIINGTHPILLDETIMPGDSVIIRHIGIYLNQVQDFDRLYSSVKQNIQN